MAKTVRELLKWLASEIFLRLINKKTIISGILTMDKAERQRTEE